MIIFPQDIDDETCLVADICIIGGGPAGIALALELQASNKKILILAGGSERETVTNQDLNRGIVNPLGTHEPLEENRRRVFGGASIVWGGRCIPLDPIDFKKRDWIPFSGWPFGYTEIEPYYKKANEICKAGVFEFNVTESSSPSNEIIKGIDNENIISSRLERWSTPVNFAKDYNEVLKNSINIEVLLDAHLVSINTDEKKESVSSLRTIAGKKEILIKANTYVLACGGIENPRLLLASKNKFHPRGIGNENDVVGRYYMAHLLGIFAEVSPTDRENIVYNFERDQEGVYCRRRWWITEKAQAEKQIGNAIFFLHQSNNQDGHRDALFSTVFVAKFILSIIKERSLAKARNSWAKSKKDLFSHMGNMLKRGWKQFPTLIQLALQRNQKRRLPFVLPSVKCKTLGLYFQTEQVPNPESRITVSDTEFDELGLPRAIVNIVFSEIDKKTIIEAHNIFMEQYTKQKIGYIKSNPKELIQFVEKRISNFNSAAHHLGTTRISQDPKYGVVDMNCQVHGIDNLFIAGASVFPTGGHANPTLTIVALAIRLANFLKHN